MTSFDAIVVGGGHNGLACATLLAKSGRKVLVCEAGKNFGGAARSEEFAPGFKAPLSPFVNRLHKETIEALDLKRHGLELGPAIDTVALSPDACPLVLSGDYGSAATGLDDKEAARWQELRARLLRFAGILRPFLFRPPPDLSGGTWAEKLKLGGAALGLRRLGRDDMREFLRLILTNVADLAEDELTDKRLQGLLSFDTVLGSHLGPRSPTSLMGLYYRLAGDVDGQVGRQIVARGGANGIVDAMERSAAASGVELRRNCSVARINVTAGRATGITLASGEQIEAAIIVSGANPVTTFLELVGPRHIDTGFATRLRHIRMKGNVARLDLALDRPARFAGLKEAQQGARLVVAPSIDHVERAFNAVKYAELPTDPVMEIVQPSFSDPGIAPDGAAVLSATIPFIPYDLRQGWEGAKSVLQEALIARLEALAPGISATIRHARLRTPVDIERDFSMPGGHWHHGELQVDQMLVNRPLHGAARYDTPIEGLYLGGAGSHPGGGISGAPGINVARRILALEKTR